MGVLQADESVIAVLQIGRGRKVGRRRPAKTPEDRGDVGRDADALTSAEPAGVALAPIGAERAVVIKMRVDVDQHGWNLRWCCILCHHRATGLPCAPRSEERRVGKECRSRWSPYH